MNQNLQERDIEKNRGIFKDYSTPAVHKLLSLVYTLKKYLVNLIVLVTLIINWKIEKIQKKNEVNLLYEVNLYISGLAKNK